MCVFPQWLMDLALLMQSNNVYVSLRKSRENAAELFASQLDELLRRIEEKPDDVESYTAFFGEFEIPEITSCMQMLYAVAENGNGDVDAQVEHLIRRIHEMQEQIQEASGEHAKFKMDMVFSYPMAAAAQNGSGYDIWHGSYAGNARQHAVRRMIWHRLFSFLQVFF